MHTRPVRCRHLILVTEWCAGVPNFVVCRVSPQLGSFHCEVQVVNYWGVIFAIFAVSSLQDHFIKTGTSFSLCLCGGGGGGGASASC